ncbi:MAG: DUF3109 family protein [Blastocatellia bacterium]|nr:DUF3109 family protein [Blastocatellia bacterium]
MIIINEILISDEIKQQPFACDLAACKGACCIEGDIGAPLEEAEAEFLQSHIKLLEPYLRRAGVETIQRHGAYTQDAQGVLRTPLIESGACAYAVLENGVAFCAIEKAYEAGIIQFRKPLSCHLYPIKLKKLSTTEALNFDRWHICEPACHLGRQRGIPVYEFVKDGLIRKYGEAFYRALAEASNPSM